MADKVYGIGDDKSLNEVLTFMETGVTYTYTGEEIGYDADNS